MDTATTVALIAAVTLGYNFLSSLMGGGWKLSNRLSSMETMLGAVREDISKLSDVLINIADMRGELKVLSSRVTSTEQDIRELRHGHGFVVNRSDGGLNGEY